MIRKFFLTVLAAVFLISNPVVLSAQNSVPSSAEAESRMVKAIEVKGNKTIALSTILSKIKTRVGQAYLQSVISDDLKRLYNTGYFSDVRVDRQPFEDGFKVFIYLEEKPIVEEITFSKTRNINTKTLRKNIKTQEGRFLDSKTLKDDVDTIKEMYSKKGLTSAEIEVEKFVDEVTNKASLHFIIREGFKIRIKNINFSGNTAFRNKRLLKVIKSRSKGWFRSGYLKEDVLEEDVERLVAFYEQHGYIDAIADFEIEKMYKGFVRVNIDITEGRKYSVGGVTVLGNKIISEKEISDAMEEIEEGNVFSRDKLSVDLNNIRSLYFDKGYIFANVQESTSLAPGTSRVDIRIDIEEGDVAYIDKVEIAGNTRTRDVVIRRELKLYPGDRFDGTKLRKSKQRLQNLGYFEEVGFDIEDTDYYDRKNLVVQVKEAKTGTFSFGGGFSTVDKIVGFIELEQRNFDIANWPRFTGGGQQLLLRAETGSTRNNYRLSFTEPWLFNNPISGGFDLYRSERQREKDTGYAYDEERTGGVLRFGKRFSDEFSTGLSYKLEEVTIENFVDNVSAALRDEEGTNLVSTIGLSSTHDTRDSVFTPTKGWILSNSVDLAGGPLGADKDFYRFSVRGSYYVPLKWNSVLELRMRTGVVNEYGDSSTVPIFERFFAGGSRTIRGYEERKVGPLDASTGDPVGGESMVVGNIEYTVPVIEFIKIAAFFDVGNVWADLEDFGQGDYKSGAGMGLRIKTPIGPVNLDYGYPLNDEPGEDGRSGKFYFSVSRGF